VPSRSRGRSPRSLLVGGAAAVALAGWIAAGVHSVDGGTEFGVYASRLSGEARTVASGLVLAPRGLARWSRWPRGPVTLPLPDASRADLVGAGGTRYGLKGTAVVRALPDQPRALGEAGGSGGLESILVASVRAAAPALAGPEGRSGPLPTDLRAIEARLRQELLARGVALEGFHLEGFDYLRAGRDIAPIPDGAKVLIVGWDGADWEIVDPLMAAGRMPNLERLVRGGVRAKFLSISPMLSPVIWTSIATGVEPARHGVMDFLTPAAGGASEPVTSRSRKVPTVWELLSSAGAPVGVIGWWATWPASPVEGYMVTDRVAYQLFGYSADPRSAEGKTWPPSLYDVVRPLVVQPDAIPWSAVVPYLDGERRAPGSFDADERTLLDEFRTLLASTQTYVDVALAMRREIPVRFEAVYFEGTDTVGHLFMPYRSPRLPSVEASRYASFHDVVDRYYETADRMLGRLLEGRDDWTVIVCSDHGFASDATRPRTTDSRIGHGAAADWHRRFGVFVMSGPAVKRDVRLEEVSVYDVAPTVLALFGQPVPASWPGHALGEALEPAWLAAHPVHFRDDPVRASDAGDAGPDDEEEARELREKLQNLGYVSGSAPVPMTTENNRGVAFLAEGKFEDAAAAFRKAIADEPEQTTLWVNLGIALRFAGKTAEAREWLERARAVPDARRAAGHQLAQLDLEAGDLAGAERELRAVLTREPGAAEVRNSLGLVLEKRGRVEEARAEYAEAARLDPNAAEPRNNLGNLAKRARRLDDAERWYRAAIDADPYFMGAYNNLALLYQDRGEIDRAIGLYDRALAKAPKNAVVLNNLASLYFATGDNVAARETWRRSVEADPKYTSPLNNLAGLALAEGNDATADDLLTRALALDPNYGDAHINRSILARKQGDMDRARRELSAAAGDPRSVETARLQSGFLELAAGRPAIAAGLLEEARKALGERTDLLNALGEAYAQSGERGKAVAVWKRSLALDPKQTRLQAVVEKLEKAE
jgi:Tfp pilus assembly protein PilF/predicted AlkP superfamily phosphohydrolase/phosphomutase